MEQQHKSAVIGLLVAIAAGVGAYMLWPQEIHAPTEGGDDTKNEAAAQNATPKTESEVSTKTTQAPKPAPKPASTPAPKPVTQGGSYEAYTPSAVGYAALGEVVLFFYSPSCPACVLLDKDILTNYARIPKDVKILKVDYDTSADLKTKYGVTEPHKLIQVNSAGNRVTQWSLSSTLSDLVTKIVRF